MPFAVTVPLDAAAAAAIAQAWRRLAAHGISESMPRLGYTPHVTFAVFEALDEVAAGAALAAIATSHPAWSGALVGLGAFATPRGVLWARPAIDATLVALQARVVATLAAPCHPHYRPGDWVAHCTLADDLAPEALARGQRLLADADVATPVRYAALELVRFPPVDVRACWPLAG